MSVGPGRALDAYRDDGPPARVLAATIGRVLPVPSAALTAVGLAPMLAVIVVDGAHASRLAAVLAVVWLVVAAGAGAGRPRGSLDWLSVGLLRAAEYAGLLWIATLAGASSPPAAFALLAVVAFRQYDLVYRLRHRGETPPAWTDAVTLGWDGRLLAALVLLLAGALPAGFYVWAGALAVVVVSESVVGWARLQRGPRTGLAVDDDGE